MKKQFIPKQQALELRKLGYDGECFIGLNNSDVVRNKFVSSHDGDYVKWDKRYDEDLPIPLFQEAFDFFREKYDFYGEVRRWYKDESEREYWWHIDYVVKNTYDDNTTLYGTSSIAENQSNMTYNQARQACLEKLIEIFE